MTAGFSNSVALVTGASRGLGRAMAVGLAKAGAQVIATARSQEALEALDDRIRLETGQSATLVPFDLTDYGAIDRLAAAVGERWGRLDILVGNAGVLGDMGPLADLKPDVFEKAMAVNVTANFRIIKALEHLLLAAPAGRALFVGSAAAWKARPFWNVYAASKAALHALVQSWAAEHVNTPLRANILDPGPFRTQMRARAMPGEDPDTLPPADDIVPLTLELLGLGETRTGEIVSYKDWLTSASA